MQAEHHRELRAQVAEAHEDARAGLAALLLGADAPPAPAS